MYDLGVSYTFNFRKKIVVSSVIFLRNGVLILNRKENKEVGAICFELRVPRKKNKEIFWKVPSQIYGSNLGLLTCEFSCFHATIGNHN